MTVTISLPPLTEAKLRDYALSNGKDVTTVVMEAIKEKFPSSEGEPIQSITTTSEFDRALEAFFTENPEPLPSLPGDFSRADIYADHD